MISSEDSEETPHPGNPEEFRRRFAVSAFDEGGVLVDVDSGHYFQLDALAVRICSAISSANTYHDAIQALHEKSGRSVADVSSATKGLLAQVLLPAPRRPPEGPFRYVPQAGGYVLLYGPTPILQVDQNGNTIRMDPGGTRVRLMDCIRCVTPKILALQGAVVLHASAVSTDGRITALSGKSGAGKTTTARALAQGRADLVAEDLVVVLLVENAVCVVRGAERQIRQWQAEATSLLEHSPGKEFSCRNLRNVVKGPVEPLAELLFLSSERRRGKTIERKVLERPDALRLLVENNFLGSADSAAWRRHLHSAHHIARTVLASETTVPKGLEGLLSAVALYTEITAS